MCLWLFLIGLLNVCNLALSEAQLYLAENQKIQVQKWKFSIKCGRVGSSEYYYVGNTCMLTCECAARLTPKNKTNTNTIPEYPRDSTFSVWQMLDFGALQSDKMIEILSLDWKKYSFSFDVRLSSTVNWIKDDNLKWSRQKYRLQFHHYRISCFDTQEQFIFLYLKGIIKAYIFTKWHLKSLCSLDIN